MNFYLYFISVKIKRKRRKKGKRRSNNNNNSCKKSNKKCVRKYDEELRGKTRTTRGYVGMVRRRDD